MAMKIGFNGQALQDRQMRGLERYTVGLLRALSECDDIELTLFCSEEPWSGHMKGVRAKVVTFSAPREFIWYDWVLPRMIRREGVSLFHAPADRGLPLLKPCPMVVTVHESYERTHWRALHPTVKGKLWYWKYELVNYWLSDAVVTVSDTTRDTLIRLRVVPEHKIHRIYSAPSADFHPGSSSEDEAVLQRYQIAQPYILYVGGYDRRKNVDLLVRAFNRANLPDHLLVIAAAHQWEYPVLIDKWRALACFPRLRLVEVATDEVPALFRKAEIFVNPSVWESFSFQLVEAMACGTPILASNRTAIPEIAGDAAILFDPEDVVALAGLIEKVAGDEDLRSELRAKCLQRVTAFSWAKTAAETVSLYQKVLSR